MQMITEREAVLKTYVLFAWMEQQHISKRRKMSYPLFYELRFLRAENHCFLCTNYKGCANCVLNEDTIDLDSEHLAEDFDCANWERSGDIARLCWNRYKKLEMEYYNNER